MWCKFARETRLNVVMQFKQTLPPANAVQSITTWVDKPQQPGNDLCFL
jgi:hypothetical protein